MPTTSSSITHQGSQVGNLGMQVASTALGELSSAAQLPFKIAQGLLSTFSIFTTDLTVQQKVTHGIQAGLSFAQAGLFIAMLYQSETCAATPPVGNLCITDTILTLIYSGVLTASTAMSYMSPNSADSPTPAVASRV